MDCQDLQNWLSCLDPALHEATKGRTNECLAMLESLMKVNNQADRDLEEVISSMRQCKDEYEALGGKLNKHLLPLELDFENLSGCLTKTLQECVCIIQTGIVGDGTSVGATLQQTTVVVESAATARKEMRLKNDMWSMSRKNAKLNLNISFYEKEVKEAMDDAKKLKQIASDCEEPINCTLKLNDEQVSADMKSVSSITDYKYLQARHNDIRIIEKDIAQLEKKLSQFGNLPPSIPEALEQLETTRKEDFELSQLLKQKLAECHVVEF